MKLFNRLLHVADPEAEMVLHAKFLMIGVGRDVEHVFNPVRAVGNLDFEPVDVGVFSRGAGRKVLEAALPIEAKAKRVEIRLVHHVKVLGNEPGVNQVRTDLTGSRAE